MGDLDISLHYLYIPSVSEEHMYDVGGEIPDFCREIGPKLGCLVTKIP